MEYNTYQKKISARCWLLRSANIKSRSCTHRSRLKNERYRVSAHHAVFSYKKCKSIIPRETRERREKGRMGKKERKKE